MVSASSHNRAEEQERQREAKSAHVASIPARLRLGSYVSRWKAHVWDRFSCVAEFIEHPPKAVNGTKDPYDLDRALVEPGRPSRFTLRTHNECPGKIDRLS